MNYHARVMQLINHPKTLVGKGSQADCACYTTNLVHCLLHITYTWYDVCVYTSALIAKQHGTLREEQAILLPVDHSICVCMHVPPLQATVK